MDLRARRGPRARGSEIARFLGRIALAVFFATLIYAEPAESANPRPPGSYVGECCGGAYYAGYTTVAELRVASSGRTLRGGRRGSYIGCYQDGTLLALRARRRVRIEPDGTFRFSGRTRRQTLAPGPSPRDFTYSVRGALTGPDTARLVYSVRPKGGGFGCPVGPRSLALRRRAGEPPFSGCTAQPAETVISSPLGRVFTQRRVFRWAFLPFAYGCLYAVDKRVPFGLDGFDGSGLGQELDQFRLAGPYAAYGCGGNLRDGCWASVSVVDLRDGVLVHSVALLQSGFSRGVAPTDVEVKENGSVAWIAGSQGASEVGAVDAAGQRVLDRRSGIDADSLTLTGSSLTWRRKGQTQQAVLD
jgi:hypothetical protein